MKYSLSPMDYYFYRPNLYTIQFVFEYQGRIDSKKLKDSFKKTADIYGPVKCKLKIISNIELQFEQDNETPCISEVELNERPNIQLPSEIDKLIDPVINQPENTLLKIKLNYFGNTTYLGISFSHMLGDGFSFLSFMKSMSQIFNGHEVSEGPALDRALLYKRPTEINHSGSLHRLFQNTGYITPRPKTPSKTKLESIIFSFDELEKLKVGVSYNSLIMASLLKKYYQHIPLTVEGKLLVRCPVDYRRTYTKIQLNYFGNAVKDAIASFDPETIENLTVLRVAEKIQESIDNINEEVVHQSLQSLDDLRLEHTISIFNELGCPGLLVTNLSRFPFSEIDFGQGSPVAIHHASQNPRLAIILSHPKGFEVRIKVPDSVANL